MTESTQRQSKIAGFIAREGALAALRVAADALRGAAPSVARVLAPDLADVRALAGHARGALAAIPWDEVRAAAGSCDGAALATTGTWYAYAAASDPDQLSYDLSFVRAGVAVAGSSLGAWLAARRHAAAVPTLVATSAVTAGLSALQLRRHGTYVTPTWREGSLRDVVFNRAMPVAHAGLAVASPLAAWVAGPSVARAVGDCLPSALRDAWPELRKLGLLYMTFSLMGHWGEMLFCTGIKHGLIRGEYDRNNHMLWDQWLFPFPAEGVAAVLMSLLLYPAKKETERRLASHVSRGLLHSAVALPLAVAETFLLNQVVCTSIDYLTGMVANQNYELWDYRDMPYNFQGQVCLQNSLFYTVLATWGVWRLFPRLERAIAGVEDEVLDGVFVGLGSFFVFLELLYHVLPPKADQAGEKNQEAPEGDGAYEQG